jgi:hypothetical protein
MKMLREYAIGGNRAASSNSADANATVAAAAEIHVGCGGGTLAEAEGRGGRGVSSGGGGAASDAANANAAAAPAAAANVLAAADACTFAAENDARKQTQAPGNASVFDGLCASGDGTHEVSATIRDLSSDAIHHPATVSGQSNTLAPAPGPSPAATG